MIEDLDVELVDKGTINFGRPLREEEIRELFVYLAGQLSSDFGYTIKRNESIDVGRADFDHVYPKVSSIEISGHIFPGKSYCERGCMLSSFNCFRSYTSRHYDRLDGIKFFITPGYDISEISEGERELMNDTRKKVNEFIEFLDDRL